MPGVNLQREEKVALILLLMVASSLAVACWAFDPHEGQAADASRSLTVEGQITQFEETRSGGHLLIRLDSTPEQIFVPADRGADELSGILEVGDRVSVTGELGQYRGQPEIRVSRSSAVQKLR
ncbi:MAG: hypothetical protein A4E47_01405 [Methanosaeta sp. PtaU1.Bin028]|nr:MAG: hypothetical protein A4E47_01405 [Methanosaeta sp. PtaU1.Bin028]